MKKILLLFTVALIGFTGCQQNDPEFSVPKAQSPAVDESIVDEHVIQSLASYNLTTADFLSDETTLSRGQANQRFGSVRQKFLMVGNEKIAYVETSGRGPDVVLVHGLSQASNSFDRQLNSVLGKVFHVVSIDLPGHGLSGDSPDPATAYQLPGYADVLVSVTHALHLEHAVFVGWSLGANVILEAADDLQDASGFMLFDVPVISNPFNPEVFLPLPEFPLLLTPELTDEEIHTVIPTFFRPDAHHIPEFFFDNMSRQDPNARLYLGVTIGTANYTDEPGVLENLSMPVAVVIGKEEQIVNIDYLSVQNIPTLWHDKIWELPNAGHASHWEQPGLFNILLAAFVIDSNHHHGI